MIRARPCVSADGYLATPDGRPAMFQMPHWDSSTDYGFPDFVEQCDAVVMGRTTFEPALRHDRRPWPGKRVYFLTSSLLPGPGDGLPLTPPGSPLSSLRLERHRDFPDGAIEHVYSFA